MNKAQKNLDSAGAFFFASMLLGVASCIWPFVFLRIGLAFSVACTVGFFMDTAQQLIDRLKAVDIDR